MRPNPLVPAALVPFISSPVCAQGWVDHVNRLRRLAANFRVEPAVRDEFITPLHGDAARGTGVERLWD